MSTVCVSRVPGDLKKTFKTNTEWYDDCFPNNSFYFYYNTHISISWTLINLPDFIIFPFSLFIGHLWSWLLATDFRWTTPVYCCTNTWQSAPWGMDLTVFTISCKCKHAWVTSVRPTEVTSLHYIMLWGYRLFETGFSVHLPAACSWIRCLSAQGQQTSTESSNICVLLFLMWLWCIGCGT